MKDKVVTISKVTLGGEEIQGALLQVIDEEGNTVDQWYSDGNEHPVSGLEEGKRFAYNVIAKNLAEYEEKEYALKADA